MKAQHKWIIVLVAHDDPEIQTRVIKERLAIQEDEQLAAFLRGGQLVMVIERGSEPAAEAQRIEVEIAAARADTENQSSRRQVIQRYSFSCDHPRAATRQWRD